MGAYWAEAVLQDALGGYFISDAAPSRIIRRLSVAGHPEITWEAAGLARRFRAPVIAFDT